MIDSSSLNKIIETWEEFHLSLIVSISSYCHFQPHQEINLERLEIMIDQVKEDGLSDLNKINEIKSLWTDIYLFLQQPSNIFPIVQITTILKQCENIMEAFCNVDLDDLTHFSLFVSTIQGLKKSWDIYFNPRKLPPNLSYYEFLYNNLNLFIHNIFTKEEHKDISNALNGISQAMFDLQMMFKQYPSFVEMVNHANKFDDALSDQIKKMNSIQNEEKVDN